MVFHRDEDREIQSRLANDVGGVQRMVAETASLMLMQLMIAISALGRDAGAVLAAHRAVAGDPAVVRLAGRAGRQARRTVSSATQQTMAELSAYAEETLSVSGVLLCRSFGWRRREIAQFHKLSSHLAQQQVEQQMIGQGMLMCLRTVFTVMPVLAYLVAGVVLAHGVSTTELSAGTLTAFTALQLQLLAPSAVLIQMGIEIQASLALFERIFAYLDLPQETVNVSDAIALPSPRVQGAISFRAVSFHYPTDGGSAPPRWALADLTLDIEPGQLAAVVGPSGSGKTTLAYLLTRLYDTTTGTVLIDGYDLRGIRRTSSPP